MKAITAAKPNWWPQNPYPEDIFPMTREDFVEMFPDPKERTAVAGCLGRLFWEIASDSIWDRVQDYILNMEEINEAHTQRAGCPDRTDNVDL